MELDQRAVTRKNSLNTAAPPTISADPLSAEGSDVNRSRLGHIPALDGIRGLAILLVVFSHLTPTGQVARRGVSHLFVRLSDSGTVGVDLFFVLSGFLITGILLRSKSSPRYFRNFYIRRALRIFPVYYFMLSLVAIILATVPAVRSYHNIRSNWPWFWFYGVNFLVARHGFDVVEGRWIELGHLWSLAVEEHFYLFWPMIVLFCSRKSLIRVCIALMIIAPIFRFLAPWTMTNPVGAYVLTWCRMDSLATGSLLAILLQKFTPAAIVRKFRSVAFISTPLFFAYLAMRLIRPDQLNSAVFRTLGNSVIALFFVSLIALSLLGGRFNRFFSAPWLRFFGVYSYGIYLWHGLLMNVLNESLSVRRLSFGGPLWIGAVPHYVLSIAVMTGVAMLSYHFIEQPFLRLKRYFRDAPAPIASPAPIQLTSASA